MNTKKVLVLLGALLVGFFNPYPVRIATAVAILTVTANLLGMLYAVQSGEGVKADKVLKGNLRIAIYFICFSALYHVLHTDTLSMRILSAVYTSIALFEFAIIIRKGAQIGIIPRALVKKLENALSGRATSGGDVPEGK